MRESVAEYICECFISCSRFRDVSLLKQTNISKPTAVAEHFLSNDHTATDMQLIPLELVKSNRDGVRKARETYILLREVRPLNL